MAESEKATPEEALWCFSLDFYALPHVADALIELQDRDGLDVNLILFALWVGISGRGRFDHDGLVRAEQAIGSIRADVVQPLRALRRNLKHSPDAEVQQLREEIKALELAGEKLAQTRLARFAERFAANTSAENRLTDALANLTLCVGPEAACGAEAAVIREALDGFMQNH